MLHGNKLLIADASKEAKEKRQGSVKEIAKIFRLTCYAFIPNLQIISFKLII